MTLESTFNTAEITAADDKNHSPGTPADELWQESWGFMWYDPLARIAGYCHTGMQPARAVADVWSWVALRGELIHRFEHLALPLPSDDYTDLKVGPLHIRSIEPNTQRVVTVRSQEIHAELAYRAFTLPLVPFGKNVKSEHISTGHYQTIGTVSGTLSALGQTFQVKGFAFDDRSWGPRNWQDQLTHRACWACFGDDLFCTMWHLTSPRGVACLGYVYDHGHLERVPHVEVEVTMAADGISPIGYTFTGWTESGRGYRITGRADGSNIMTQRDGFMQCAAVGRFEYGDRIGVGACEVNELKRPAPWHREHLGRGL